MATSKTSKASFVIATGKSEIEYTKGLKNYEKNGEEPKGNCWVCRRVQGEKTVKLIDNAESGKKVAHAYETELYYTYRKADTKNDIVWQYCLCADCINLIESVKYASGT